MIFCPCIRPLPLKTHSLKGRSNPWLDGRRHGKPSPRWRVGRGMSCLEERGKEKPHLESTMAWEGIKKGQKSFIKMNNFFPSPQPWLALFLAKLQIFTASCNFLRVHPPAWPKISCLHFRTMQQFFPNSTGTKPRHVTKKPSILQYISTLFLCLYRLDSLLLSKH